MAKNEWGFNTQDLDTAVRPQDDLYQHANGGWFKRTQIPDDESRWGTFLILRKQTELQLRKIVENLQKIKEVRKGEEAQQIRDLYASAMDMKRRNALDVKPVEPLLAKIEKLKDVKELLALLPLLHREWIGVLWGANVEQDDKNVDRYILHVHQDGLGLPDRDYYLFDKPEQLRVRAAYENYIERLLKLLDLSDEEIARRKKAIMTIETKLARASMRRQDMREPEKIYHKMSRAKLQKLAPLIPFNTYLDSIGAKGAREINVMQPKFIETVGKMLTSVPLEDWKAYIAWHVIAEAAPRLSDRFIKEQFEYVKALTGTQKLKDLWRRALSVTNNQLGEALGKLYVKEHFPPEAKRLVDELITDIFAAYKDRLLKLDWMSETSKKKALIKLSKMVRKIGYPKKWKSYKGLVIDPTDYYGNVIRGGIYEHKRNFKKLGRKVDRGEWHMYPQEVNAYFNPVTNEIAFPAAILQPPYFGVHQDAALNYGAIGAVIGHEITHGFDDQGSKYDFHGNLKTWWTKEDRKRFEKKAAVLKKQFDQYQLHGVNVNGKLTLGENIADLGGYAIALDAYRLYVEKHGSHEIDGYTPVQRFFFAAALDWRELARPEVQKLVMLTDPHSPPIFRTNGPASNSEAFYEAFNVKKGDKLYREPRQRAKIW